MNTKIKSLSITEARKLGQHDPIWVLNNTVFNPDIHKKSDVMEKSNVVFTLRMKNGDVATVPVFATWVPTCLTEVIPREELISSQTFMRAVNIGKLLIIDNESAQRMLAEPGAREEFERVRKMDINSATGMALGTPESSSTTQIEVVEASGEKREPGMSAQVINFIQLMSEGTPIEALNSLRSLGNLTKEEWLQILKESKSLGDSYKGVSDYCRNMLNTIEA